MFPFCDLNMLSVLYLLHTFILTQLPEDILWWIALWHSHLQLRVPCWKHVLLMSICIAIKHLLYILAIVVHLAVCLSDPSFRIETSIFQELWVSPTDMTLSLRKWSLPRSCSLLGSAHLQWLVHVSLKAWLCYFDLENSEEPTFPMNAVGLAEASSVASESQCNFSLCPVLLTSFPYRWFWYMSIWAQILHVNFNLRRCFWRPQSKSIGANSDPKKQTIKWDIGNGSTIDWPLLWILLIGGGMLISSSMLDEWNYWTFISSE